jgi:hypothetical protein
MAAPQRMERGHGIASSVFAILIVLPILDIYRKYYGVKISAFLLGVFYASMSLAALAVEFLFLPDSAAAASADYGRIDPLEPHDCLNIIFLALAARLVIRFLRTGDLAMLRMMSASHPGDQDHAAHHHDHAM